MRPVFKLAGISLLILLFFFLQTPTFLFIKWFPFRVRKYANQITSLVCRICLFIMGVDIRVVGTPPFRRPSLRISNHLSYLDILVHAAFNPCTFVTSQEIKETPFLGPICLFSGSLFVERRSKKNLIGEIDSLAFLLERGLSLCVFPEATSTDGRGVLTFKSPLFKSAVKGKRPVVPLTLNYLALDQLPVDVTNRDLICWYGEMTFFPHLWKLLHIRKIQAELVSSPSLFSPHYRELAKMVEEKIRLHFKPLC